MSVNTIKTNRCSQAQAASVTAFLQAHGATAVIETIYVESVPHNAYLKLPVQQLGKLQGLELHWMQASAAPEDAEAGDGGDAGPASALLSPALTSLTRLDWDEMESELQGLPALTGLQYLRINSAYVPDDLSASNAAVLAEALPQLTGLTLLHLRGGVTKDAVVADVSLLTRLQDLGLKQ